MRLIYFLFLFWGFSTSAHAFEHEELDEFLGDLIDTWQLRSPTIIIQGDFPELCMRRQWTLCLSNGLDTDELGNHLALTHQLGRQDGIILVGRTGHEQLLRKLAKGSPPLLRTNYPVFMPASYKNKIMLRLDSNIVLFNESSARNWKLLDIFSVKNEPPITLEIGIWDTDAGMMLQKSLNRWDRRTDLRGATFVNCFASNGRWSEFIRDKNGRITGSEGYFQDMLFYITDAVKLTVETCEVEWGNKLLANGSWTSGIGALQRRESDVGVAGINLQRSHYIDYPITADYQPITLHAAIRKGSAPNMWVFVRVFGPFQWMIFAALLVLLVIGLHVFNVLSHDESSREFGTKRGANKNYQLNSASSGFALVCLYTIQMGSHTNSKLLASRLSTLTISMLTFIAFAYYTTDITSEMTSGAAEIPIRTFDDVVHYNYKVVTHGNYYQNLLKRAKPGTAMNTVYKNHFEKKKNIIEAFEEVVKDPKTLHFGNKALVRGLAPPVKALVQQTFPLNMDDAVYSSATMTLQKDSEFLQLFNHYILKAHETGLFKRFFRKHYMNLFTKENYEMVEPQPLGFNNVMFLFIVLAVGICLSVTLALTEFALKKSHKQQKRETSPVFREARGRRERVREMGGRGSDGGKDSLGGRGERKKLN